MVTKELVDYAMPLMNIERLAKEAHQACLNRNYEEAKEYAIALAVEARMLRLNLALMAESNK